MTATDDAPLTDQQLIQGLVDALQLALNLIPSAIEGERRQASQLDVTYHELAMLMALAMAAQKGYTAR